jgi:pimeloyl-ACP methyl ester carboxylesterase
LLQAVEQTCGKPESRSCLRSTIERRQLVGDVHEYSMQVQVGPGAYDVVTLHRVVREVSPGKPVRAPKSVFMVHGDVWNFRGAFLPGVDSGAVPARRSIAIYLAEQGVDVWGIDLRWANVPAETADFSFMKGWNLGTHAQDVGLGMAVARVARGLTGSGLGPMNLMGWSRGALVAYAYANAETRLPQGMRQVSGLIPVDMVLKFAPEDEALRQAACGRHEALKKAFLANALYEGGAMGEKTGLLVQSLGLAALQAPDAASHVPGLTNKQFAITLGAATYALAPPAVPFYHFHGGQLSQGGALTGLTWTHEQHFFQFLLKAVPYQSVTEIVESEALLCGESLPYDDHLQDIQVPVLYVGAAGGFGRNALHGLSRLGSKDVTVHMVQRFPEEYRALDYGHADLFLAEDAQAEVWTPMLRWLQSH